MAEVVVVGATGRQGGAVARLLLGRGHRVTALAHTEDARTAALKEAGAKVGLWDASAPAVGLDQLARGADAMFALTVPRFGKDAEVAQGAALAEAARAAGLHLVFSSIRGADRLDSSRVEHANAKQLIEAHLREDVPEATVLGPAYFMENLLNVGFVGLTRGVYASPLTPDKPMEMTAIADIAALAVHAVENPGRLRGRRIDVASDKVTGLQVARILGDLVGRELPYRQLGTDRIEATAGPEVAQMFRAFEANTEFVNIEALRAEFPSLPWHSFQDWAATIAWGRLLADARP